MTHPTTSSPRRFHPRRASLALAVAAMVLACGPEAGSNPLAPSLATNTSTARASAVGGVTGVVEQTFEGTLQAVSRPTYDPATNSNIVHLVGTVSAHPYGQFTLVADFTVALATELSVGRLTLTARNGDVITATFTGKSSPVAPGVIGIIENATITSGTGRFAGATGSFVVERTLVRASGVTSGSFSGIIVRENDGN
ncbi:MAG: hypothetical protein ABIP93_05050 [Gemmatimonadaceae bacterium]